MNDGVVAVRCSAPAPSARCPTCCACMSKKAELCASLLTRLHSCCFITVHYFATVDTLWDWAEPGAEPRSLSTMCTGNSLLSASWALSQCVLINWLSCAEACVHVSMSLASLG